MALWAFFKNNIPPHLSVSALGKGFRTRRGRVGAFVGGLLLLTVSGCSASLILIPNTAGNGTSVGLTGNWVLQFTATSGATELTQLSGFINQVGDSQDTATAALQGTLSDCFAGQSFLPWYGNISGTSVSLYSFVVDQESVTIASTSDSTQTHLTGTYTVHGPCADGATGNVSGTRYASLTGTYSGALASNAGQHLQLVLKQNAVATGDGTFFVTGSAALQGFTCFTTATIPANGGSVVGSGVLLHLTTNEAGPSTLTLSGSFDPSADTITANSIQISGGQCPGDLGGATLTRQ